MILRIGHKSVRARAAFTLIELILVMAMLVVVLGIAFPTLGGFFRGRNLDAEARRFVSLARYGQSRAVSEGVPTVLWVDARRNAYGLEIQPGYVVSDSRMIEFALDEDLEVEVQSASAPAALPAAQRTLPGIGNVPMIRFLPSGFIGETSPDVVVIRQGAEDAIWIARAANGLSYEIQTNAFYVRR
jgi:type IV fimbrial biogenesis protein FimT